MAATPDEVTTDMRIVITESIAEPYADAVLGDCRRARGCGWVCCT
jgi:hypothetical protein